MARSSLGLVLALGFAVTGACSGRAPPIFFEVDTGIPEDAGGAEDVSLLDVAPAMDLSVPDREAPDRGVIDVAEPDPGPETGGMPGVCPASCGVAADCDPCWGSSPRTGQYCCASGLCIYRGAGESCDFDAGSGGGLDGFSFDLGGAGRDVGTVCRTDRDCPMGQCCFSFFGPGICVTDRELCKL